jgi:hypothetical protein
MNRCALTFILFALLVCLPGCTEPRPTLPDSLKKGPTGPVPAEVAGPPEAGLHQGEGK